MEYDHPQTEPLQFVRPIAFVPFESRGPPTVTPEGRISVRPSPAEMSHTRLKIGRRRRIRRKPRQVSGTGTDDTERPEWE